MAWLSMRDRSPDMPMTRDYGQTNRRRTNLFRGLAASVIALALLPACGPSAAGPRGTSTSHTAATTTAAAAPPPAAAPRTVTWVDLQVGDCLAAIPRVDVGEVTA